MINIMNLDFAHNDMITQKYTDAKIIIRDDLQTIELFVHKIILASNSPYFDTMFMFNTSQKEFAINVVDAFVMHDLIMSFYGQNKKSSEHPRWLYNINKYKARDFLCMPPDLNLLYNLQIPAQGFEMLLEILERFDLSEDKKLIELIHNNLPENYDTNIFPSELLNEWNKKSYKIAIYDEKSIKIFNSYSGTIIRTINREFDPKCLHMICSSDNKLLATNFIDGATHIWQMASGSFVAKINTQSLHTMLFSPNNQMLLTVNPYAINIWCIDSQKKWKTFRIQKICAIKYTSAANKLIIGTLDGTIQLLDIDSGQTEYIFDYSYGWPILCLSNDDKLLAVGKAACNIYIIDLQNKTIVKDIQNNFLELNGLCFSPDNKYIACGGYIEVEACGCIEIVDIETLDILTTIKDKSNVTDLKFTDDGEYIIGLTPHDKAYLKFWYSKTGQLFDFVGDENIKKIAFPF